MSSIEHKPTMELVNDQAQTMINLTEDIETPIALDFNLTRSYDKNPDEIDSKDFLVL